MGDLGSGKTTFIQGFLKMLGVKQSVISPTFLIFRPYPLPTDVKHYQTAYHVDLYRIKSAKELEILNFKDIIKDPRNIVLIEWANKIKRSLPKNTIWLRFEHSRKPTERIITI